MTSFLNDFVLQNRKQNEFDLVGKSCPETETGMLLPFDEFFIYIFWFNRTWYKSYLVRKGCPEAETGMLPPFDEFFMNKFLFIESYLVRVARNRKQM